MGAELPEDEAYDLQAISPRRPSPWYWAREGDGLTIFWYSQPVYVAADMDEVVRWLTRQLRSGEWLEAG